MRRKDRNILIFEMIILLLIMGLSLSILKDQYLFDYLNHNWIFALIISLIPITFLAFNKQIASIISFLGISIGLFVSNYLGEFIHTQNVAKISSSMNPEELARLQNYPSFYIWISIILTTLIIGLLAQKFYKQKDK